MAKMKQYISEGRAMYEDENHGLFSKRLAEWAIKHMETEDEATGELKPIKARPLEEVQAMLKEHKIDMPDAFLYTAWYLFNMAVADYPKSLKMDADRITWVEETICDPDCCPEAVLECFAVKMCLMGIPVQWERYL